MHMGRRIETRLAAPSLEEAAAPLAAGKATCPPGVPRCTAVEGMVRVELAYGYGLE